MMGVSCKVLTGFVLPKTKCRPCKYASSTPQRNPFAIELDIIAFAPHHLEYQVWFMLDAKLQVVLENSFIFVSKDCRPEILSPN